MTDRTNGRSSAWLRAAILLGVVLLPACQDSSVTGVEAPRKPSFALLPGEQQVTWDFDVSGFTTDWSYGASSAPGVSTTSTVSATISQNCGGPAEWFYPPAGWVHLTRYWGANACYPFIAVNATGTVVLKNISYFHASNHNPGYPTEGGYNAQMQINQGAGWVNIGNPVWLSNDTYYQQGVVNLGGATASGSFQLRWIPTGLVYGDNTSSEYFAMWDVALTVGVNPADANACKNGGFAQYGFRNQGLCVAFVNTGKDSR